MNNQAQGTSSADTIIKCDPTLFSWQPQLLTIVDADHIVLNPSPDRQILATTVTSCAIKLLTAHDITLTMNALSRSCKVNEFTGEYLAMNTEEPNMTATDSSSPSALPRSLMDCLYAQLSEADLGGLPVLIGNFHAAGMGEIIDSWAAPGTNLPVSADQIQRVFGKTRIQQLADAANISPATVRDRLVEVLPILVKTLSTGGKLPDKK